MRKNNTTVRFLMLVLGSVLVLAIVSLQVLQYKTNDRVKTEQSETPQTDSRSGEEVLTMPACAQSSTTAQENSSGLHPILEIFPVEPDDEPTRESSSTAWTALLEKILRVVISPNAP
ncbi:MAG: hypothetical protein N2044_05440 [Cyclobacteriaceae bacterium]|nr:hypothetical protein [Cyclobacteriaceae bacterium]MCX7637275.1 hypothetical protein [Cyclobacteriaceae bacterium]MDW8331268.1 hypothetical protein [Cyclobacteriaceae bacterium]